MWLQLCELFLVILVQCYSIEKYFRQKLTKCVLFCEEWFVKLLNSYNIFASNSLMAGNSFFKLASDSSLEVFKLRYKCQRLNANFSSLKWRIFYKILSGGRFYKHELHLLLFKKKIVLKFINRFWVFRFFAILSGFNSDSIALSDCGPCLIYCQFAILSLLYDFILTHLIYFPLPVLVRWQLCLPAAWVQPECQACL